ncbi:hypothetical protein TNCV_332451 [Trichonephila clavipes]|nr:hypothetical protein TNCV_332451 [Trichonephila clavipes]
MEGRRSLKYSFNFRICPVCKEIGIGQELRVRPGSQRSLWPAMGWVFVARAGFRSRSGWILFVAVGR